MSNDKLVSAHYGQANLLKIIQSALLKLGKTTETITMDELSLIDEFHIGRREGTEKLFASLSFSKNDHILDIGCGIGGAARFAATKYQNKVTGIDLTQEYIDTGNMLSEWLKLNHQVQLQRANALSIPFGDKTFDGAYMIHSGMNIENKQHVFNEAHRILKTDALFAIYDVMLTNQQNIRYPVPWADDPQTSFLASSEQYQSYLTEAGFQIINEIDYHDFAVAFFQEQNKNLEKMPELPPLGLHILMKEKAALKMKNMLQNIVSGTLSPKVLIAKSKSY